MVKKVKSRFHSCPLKTSTEYWRFLKFKGVLLGAWLIGCLFLAAVDGHAQVDSTKLRQDSTVLRQSETVPAEITSDTSGVKRLDPQKALFYSAVLPGFGQIYNGKYWKLPFVYGGFAVSITIVNFYQKNYEKYRDELFTFLATGNSPNNLPESTLRYVVDKTRRERDYYIILTGIWYLLQVVDAHVDAHLQDFKFSKNLDITLRPSMNQNYMIGRTAGLTLTFKF